MIKAAFGQLGEPLYAELVHPNGDRRIVMVETYTPKLITVRWGMAGLYDINLSDNTMRARSASARRKNPCCHWKLVDVTTWRATWRAVVKEAFTTDKSKQVQEMMQKHDESMPWQK